MQRLDPERRNDRTPPALRYAHAMESPFEGTAPYPGPLKTNTTAIVSILASLSGFVCFFWGVGGVLGFVLGLIARSEIKRSEGRESGAGLALAGIILGGLNLAVTMLVFGLGIAQIAVASRKVSLPPGPAVAVAPSTAPSHPKPPRKPAERSSRDATTIVSHVGSITLVDLADAPGELASNLDAQRAAAAAASETVLLWLVEPNCKPCDGLAAALGDARMQRALFHVRLVRIEKYVFQAELEVLAIPAEKIPGFVLLDGLNHARDFIHGGEWDADVAANIAPVLGKFVRGTYLHRRDPWHGGAREDETPI
jgi:hypothetical protein